MRSPAEQPGTSREPLLLHGQGTSCRVRPWAFGSDVAQLVMYDQRRVPTPQDVSRWLAAIVEHGYSSVRTGALNESQAGALAPHGFTRRQLLALLEHPAPRDAVRRDRTSEAVRARTTTRRLTVADHRAAATVDRAAFTEPWALDGQGIADVCAATSRHRARCVGSGNALVAYAVSGRDRRLGFLQRLAVVPECQGNGLGRALVVDSLRWAARWRCERVMVNTDVSNEPALALYQHLGFVRLPSVLAVLERPLP